MGLQVVQRSSVSWIKTERERMSYTFFPAGILCDIKCLLLPVYGILRHIPKSMTRASFSSIMKFSGDKSRWHILILCSDSSPLRERETPHQDEQNGNRGSHLCPSLTYLENLSKPVPGLEVSRNSKKGLGVRYSCACSIFLRLTSVSVRRS